MTCSLSRGSARMQAGLIRMSLISRLLVIWLQ